MTDTRHRHGDLPGPAFATLLEAPTVVAALGLSAQDVVRHLSGMRDASIMRPEALGALSRSQDLDQLPERMVLDVSDRLGLTPEIARAVGHARRAGVCVVIACQGDLRSLGGDVMAVVAAVVVAPACTEFFNYPSNERVLCETLGPRQDVFYLSDRVPVADVETAVYDAPFACVMEMDTAALPPSPSFVSLLERPTVVAAVGFTPEEARALWGTLESEIVTRDALMRFRSLHACPRRMIIDGRDGALTSKTIRQIAGLVSRSIHAGIRVVLACDSMRSLGIPVTVNVVAAVVSPRRNAVFSPSGRVLCELFDQPHEVIRYLSDAVPR